MLLHAAIPTLVTPIVADSVPTDVVLTKIRPFVQLDLTVTSKMLLDAI